MVYLFIILKKLYVNGSGGGKAIDFCESTILHLKQNIFLYFLDNLFKTLIVSNKYGKKIQF